MPGRVEYLPDLERLPSKLGTLRLHTPNPFDREPDVLALTPVASSKLAAIVLVRRVLVRRSWREDVEVPKTAAEALPVEPPAVADDWAPREHTYRVGVPEPMRCTHCAIRPGFGPCAVCVGTGWRPSLGDDPGMVRCDCDRGFVRCTRCGGSATSYRVTLEHASDKTIFDRQTFVPSLVGTLTNDVRQKIDAADVPEALRFELAPTLVQSAYRGAMSAAQPTFEGYDFLDAYPRAIATLRASQAIAGDLRREDAAYAWPFLCLRYEVEGRFLDVAVVPDKDGRWSASATGLTRT
jgi:hypothetical protein